MPANFHSKRSFVWLTGVLLCWIGTVCAVAPVMAEDGEEASSEKEATASEAVASLSKEGKGKDGRPKTLLDRYSF